MRLGVPIERERKAAMIVDRVMISTLLALAAARGAALHYAPAPVDNPLKGLVPYTTMVQSRFPHSMEMSYLPLSDLMKGPHTYDWTELDKVLELVSSRGHQTVFRVYLEYPKRPSGVPAFLKKEGVKVRAYRSAQPNNFSLNDPKQSVDYYTPDYSDPHLGATLQQFITALGHRYDGDPRIGFITAGLLGYWGEWHTYPNTQYNPPIAIQRQVIDAYQRAFHRTRILLRYPSAGDAQFAANADQPFGYHDESFAWSTVPTKNPPESWFFVTQLAKAGALNKWTKYPIGGEIRPEAWGAVFDARPGASEIQDFRACVDATHASWLMDSGMFNTIQPPSRIERAEEEVQHMGYELMLTSARLDKGRLTVRVENRGVAPFYYPWAVELAEMNARGEITRTWKPGWHIDGILPGHPANWTTSASLASGGHLLLRVPNPMPGGHPVKFANAEQDRDRDGWVTLL